MKNTLEQYFKEWAQEEPDRAAVVGLARPALTFGQLAGQLETLRAELRQRGFDRPARLALLAPNGPDLALAFLAGATAAVCAPLNPAYRREELTFYLDDLAASALVIADTLDSPAREVARARGLPILELHPQPAGGLRVTGPAGGTAVPELPARPDDLALILHTSGTTARPKQVPLTHANLCASIRHLQATLALTPADRCLNLMPLFHIHGLVGALLAALGSGGSVVCPPGFSAPEVLGWLERYQPTWYTAVPTIHQALLAAARPAARPPHTLRFIRSSSASLPPTVMAELEACFGVPVIEAYGMTEAAHQMASNPLPPGVRKPGSVGQPAGPALCILAPDGTARPQGEVGEVAIQGPNVMSGYRQNPAANAQAFTAGWFRTGDQGYLDAEGYLFLTGRLKELINRGGEKIAPVEIDQALLAHPAVQQAVTFALAHPTLGEEVAAAVVLHAGATVTAAQLQQFLTQSLADFKIPRQLLFVPDIPKGPTGKVQRRQLSEQLSAYVHSAEEKVSEPIHLFLQELFQKILKLDHVGLDDNFFVVGGDSLRAVQIANRVRDIFSLPLDAVTIFEHPTVRTLSQHITDSLGADSVTGHLQSVQST